jgi:prevent-host-death family protein
MDRISCAQFRKEMAEYLDRVKYRGERIVIHRRGREAAVLVPLEDLAALEGAVERAEEPERVLVPKKARARRASGLGLDALRKDLGL